MKMDLLMSVFIKLQEGITLERSGEEETSRKQSHSVKRLYILKMKKNWTVLFNYSRENIDVRRLFIHIEQSCNFVKRVL